jgi:hypothetical protein
MSDFLRRDDFFGDITPENFRNENVILPQGTYIPAKWLPVVWVDTNRDAGSDAFVISKGKPVSFDSQGDLIPSSFYYFVSTVAATSETCLTYTATDVTWKVQDLVTGLPVAAAVSYTAEVVAKALRERGLVPSSLAAVSNLATCKAVFAAFVSLPVGLAPYDYFKYGGKAENGDQAFTNYLKQSNVQFITEMMLDLPHRIGASLVTDEFDADSGATTVTSSAAAAGVVMAAGEVWNATALASLTRYSLMGVTASKPVVGLKLSQGEVAHVTERTTFSCDDASVLVKAKTSPAAIRSEGDYYIDFEQGVLFIHSDVWDTLVADSTVFNVSFYVYALGTAASSQRYVYFEGVAQPGARIGIDKKGNFVKSGSASDIFSGVANFGFLNFAEYEPYALMDKVKSATEPRTQSIPATARMPGTATKGFSDGIMKAESTVADRHAILTLRFL